MTPPPRVLLIDDDPALLDALALAFEDEGFAVDTARDGRAGLARIRAAPAPDVVVSDVTMPALDGLALCRRVREAGILVPLVLLTSRDAEVDQVLGLELGADDYVTKPFSTRVLIARVQALLRRDAARAGRSVAAASPPQRAVGGLALDAERLEVALHGTPVAVTMTEFRLVAALVARPGVVFSRDRLLELARGDGGESVVEARIIDTYVNRLRRKFEAVRAEFDQIETVVGAGYRWRDERDRPAAPGHG